jgi:hypothetical protein
MLGTNSFIGTMELGAGLRITANNQKFIICLARWSAVSITASDESLNG